MSFIDKMKETLDEEFNLAVTENGAIGYRSTGRDLLNLSYSVSSLRRRDADYINDRFSAAFFTEKVNTLRWLFYAADVREGLGERRLFRIILRHLGDTEPKIAEALIPLVPEYTRWDNLFCLFDTRVGGCALDFIKKQLDADIAAKDAGKPVSLLAKWLPSPNAHSAESRDYSRIIMKHLGLSNAEYRKTLAALRSYMKVVESVMTRGAFGEIDYEAVPSKANVLYRNAFLRRDTERRREFLEKLTRGEAKINAGVLFPHDIVSAYSADGWFGKLLPEDAALEALWRGLPDYVQGRAGTLCVCDCSGSMYIPVDPRAKVRAVVVSIALAVYCAERLSGEFHDKFINFSNTPELVDLSPAKCLRDKIAITKSHALAASTNIEAVFDLVLATAIKSGMKQEDLPKSILILSDMEFNEAVVSNESRDVPNFNFKRLFAIIGERYERYGYSLPRLVFWNIASRSLTVPVKQNEHGVALISGFSPSALSAVFSDKLDPYECLLEQISVERYLPVERAVEGLV